MQNIPLIIIELKSPTDSIFILSDLTWVKILVYSNKQSRMVLSFSDHDKKL